MTMLNQAAVEALCSATYLENYLECLDSLPEELQRNVSVLRELDAQYTELLREIDQHKLGYLQTEGDTNQRKRALMLLQRALIKCQELGDDKLQVVSQIIECVENRSRQLNQDLENLDPICGKDVQSIEVAPSIGNVKQTRPQPKQQHPVHVTQKPTQQSSPAPLAPVVHTPPPQQTKQTTPMQQRQQSSMLFVEQKSTTGKRQRRQRQHHEITKIEEKKEEKEPKKKKKKRKVKKEKEGNRSPMDIPIEPGEPTYCLCDQVSYGEMIGCDNDDCKIEWFHFNCVNLTQKPKGKWFCPNCRGDNSKVQRKDLK